MPLALVAIGLFAVCVLVVAGPISPRDAVVYAAVVCSPSILLGIERGNIDLLVFAALTLLVVTLRKRSAWLRGLGHATLLLAALLKVYPVLAVSVVLRLGVRRAAAGAIAALVPSVFISSSSPMIFGSPSRT